jgi:hypothetical protein
VQLIVHGLEVLVDEKELIANQPLFGVIVVQLMKKAAKEIAILEQLVAHFDELPFGIIEIADPLMHSSLHAGQVILEIAFHIADIHFNAVKMARSLFVAQPPLQFV